MADSLLPVEKLVENVMFIVEKDVELMYETLCKTLYKAL